MSGSRPASSAWRATTSAAAICTSSSMSSRKGSTAAVISGDSCAERPCSNSTFFSGTRLYSAATLCATSTKNFTAASSGSRSLSARSGQLISSREYEAFHRWQRRISRLEHQRQHARLLLVVGDAWIDAEGVAQEQRIDGGLGLELAQLFDGALPIFRRPELLHRFLGQAPDLAFRPPHPDKIHQSHGVLLQHEQGAHVGFVELL